MEVCYWALLFMPLVILHHLLNVFVQLANKRGFTKKKKKYRTTGKIIVLYILIFTVFDSRREDRRFWTEWTFTNIVEICGI
jgi:hypothetical protein